MSRLARILVVDDEPLFRRSISDALSDRFEDVVVVSAANGADGLRVVESGRVDLLISDVRMPQMDGVELLAALGQAGHWCPVILVTAHGTRSLRLDALDRGAVEFFEKPVDLDELLASVDRILRHEAAGALQGISVAGMAQLVGLERKSCSLQVRSGPHRGTLFFADGQLVDAAFEGHRGEDAARAILDLQEATLTVAPPGAGDARTITTPLEHLLLAVAQRRDETGRGSSISPAGGALALADGEPSPEPAAHPIATETPTQKEKRMANVNQSLNAAMDMEGSIAAALVDWESGLTLGTAGGGEKFDIELAASGNTQVVNAKMGVMKSLGLEGPIEDILITLDGQYHLIRPLKKVSNLFLYLAIDKNKGNLGLARHKLKSIEEQLEI